MRPRRGQIPAAFLKHPPPSWEGKRIHGGRHRSRFNVRAAIIRNPIIREGLPFNPHRRRRNPIIHNNPGGKMGMGTWLLIGGGAFLLLTGSGRAMLSSLTGGGTAAAGMTVSPNQTAIPSTLPAGTVRLANGAYRLPNGQVVTASGVPYAATGGVNVGGIFASMIPSVTNSITSWLHGLTQTSSATTPGTLPEGGAGTGTVSGDPLGTGAGTGTAPDILSGGGWAYGDPLPPLPDLGDVTLGNQVGGTDFWAGLDTSNWWGYMGSGGSGFEAPVLDLSLTSPDFTLPDLEPLSDPWAGDYLSGFMGLGQVPVRTRYGNTGGWAPRLRQPASYR